MHFFRNRHFERNEMKSRNPPSEKSCILVKIKFLLLFIAHSKKDFSTPYGRSK